MAVQRHKLDTANFRGVDWGEGVKTHVREDAEDFVQRKKERFEEYKKQYTDAGKHIGEVDVADAGEYLKEVEASRDEIAKSIKENGINSVKHIQNIAAIQAKLNTSARDSQGMAKNYQEAAAFIKANPYIQKKQAEDWLNEQLTKPRSERSKTPVKDLNDMFYNFDQSVADDIDRISPEQKKRYLKTTPEGYETREVTSRGKFAKPNEKDPNVMDASISDEAMDELIRRDPAGWKRLAQKASQARAAMSVEQIAESDDEYLEKVPAGDVLKDLENMGAGPEVEAGMIRAFGKSYLATVHKDKIFPSETTAGFQQKHKEFDYGQTQKGVEVADKTKSVQNLKGYIKDGPAGLPAIQSLFAKTGEGNTKVVYNPAGNLIVLKAKPAGKEERADKRRREERLAQYLQIKVEDLKTPEYSWASGMIVDEAFDVAGADEGTLDTIADAIHKKTGESKVTRTGPVAPTSPSGKKANPMKKK